MMWHQAVGLAEVDRFLIGMERMNEIERMHTYRQHLPSKLEKEGLSYKNLILRKARINSSKLS